jgi:aryl-alcohol dehydrogenase-like predicted oxidoreductase
MRYRTLAIEKLRVSAIGYGCPSFLGKASPEFEKAAIRLLHRAVDLGDGATGRVLSAVEMN